MTEEVHTNHHPTMSGWLHKWTNYLRGYEKRWFVLSCGYLSYYRNPEEMTYTCRGTLSLRGATVHSDSSNYFVISNGDTFHIKAENNQDKERWVEALIAARNVSAGSTSEIDKDESSILSLTDTLTKKLDDVKASSEMVSVHGQALQHSLSNLANSMIPLNAVSKELEERIAIFRASTSAMTKACSEYSDLADRHKNRWMSLILNNKDQSMNVVDLVTQIPLRTFDNSGPARISSSNEDSQVYYDCEESHSISGISNSTIDNNRVHMYPAVVQPRPSTSCGGYTRRRRIPNRPPVPMSIWGTISNGKSKDISKMALPVAFSEPLSALQRLTEDFEYAYLLDRASNLDDPGEQLAYVAGFAVSSYSNSWNRVTKPFNPLLGETFECDRTDDLGWKSIAEQVSHHPPTSALHCEGKEWECWQEQTITTKYRGQYLQIIPLGEVHLKFRTGHRYAWKKVITNIRGLIFGKMCVDQEGEMEIKCYTNSFICKVSFYVPGLFGGESYKIKGTVSDNKGITLYHVSGNYESSVEIIKANDPAKGKRSRPHTNSNLPVVIWEKVNPSEDSDKYYNFTVFACQLNEMEDGVAPTDSRLRPDQRLMEEGNWDKSNELKLKLEDAQRKRRAATKEQRKPTWFHLQPDPDTKTQMYVYNGEYWPNKKKKDWGKCPQIFGI